MQIKSRESIYIRKVTRLAFLVCSLGKLSEGQLYHLANRCCKLFLKPLTLILQRCWQRADCSKRASALETLYVGQLQLSSQLIKPNHLVIFLPTQHHRSFLKLTIVLFIGCLLNWYVQIVLRTFYSLRLARRAGNVSNRLFKIFSEILLLISSVTLNVFCHKVIA